jgi:hypothetical protein
MSKLNKLIFVFVSFLITAHAIAQTHSLPAGWSLVGNDAGTDVTPLTIFGDATTPTPISSSIKTIWTWDNLNSRWNFYAPSMTAPALSTYANSQGYGVLSKILKGEGFWLNSNSAVIVSLVQASSTIPYTITWHEVSGNCTLYADVSFAGVLTPSGQANIYTTVWYSGGAAITLTVPGSNAFDYSYAEAGGTSTDHTQLTFDSQSRSISGSMNWTHTNGCTGYVTFSGSW